MALEQLRAFRAGTSQAELGETRRLDPDGFPLLMSSPLQRQHEDISALLRNQGNDHGGQKLMQDPAFLKMLSADTATRTGYFLALLERTFACDSHLSTPEGYGCSSFFDYGPAANAMAALYDRGVEVDAIIGPTLEWYNSYRFNCYGTPALERAIAAIEQKYSGQTLPEDLRQQLIAVRGQLGDGKDLETVLANVGHWMHKATGADGSFLRGDLLPHRVDKLLGQGPWLTLVPCEVWTRDALAQLSALADKERNDWFSLLNHCRQASAARPSTKWSKTGMGLVNQIGAAKFVGRLLEWFPLVNAGRIHPLISVSWENGDDQQRMHETNAVVLRGLLWLCPSASSPELIRAIGRVAVSAYRKVKGLGPRASKVGNAAIYALSQINDPNAVGQLALLKVKVKFIPAQKEIEKAFTAAAERAGLPRAEIEEMSVPTYGLTAVGVCEEQMGEFVARLSVVGTITTELVWVKPDGKTQRGVPAAVKESHKEELKELQAAAKDIQKMLPAQRERIDGLFLQQKTWPLAIWQERYLDHPLIGTLARRILWEFQTADQTVTAIWFNGALVDLDLKPIAPREGVTTVKLWHPIGKPTEEIVAWRSWLDAQQIQQPFKQAHREIYVLTDAERNTRVYSNRYAAHIIKQHQFNALCALRGWKNKLRLMVDAEFPPASLLLPQWGLRAEFWIEAIGTDYGADTNDSGTYLYLSTDQVRFYRVDAVQRTAHAGGGGYHPDYRNQDAEPVPLEEIPPLVLSEVMRDVDLFVGVASVGNDPTWNDGGPEGRYRDYWQNYSFGDLNASAKTRKDVLQRLLPRLKIAKQCSFEDKFLVVRGSLRTYKIHLGSGNILMEPNDQYLCIVPKQGEQADEVLLPFEGDRTLSVILSKAFLLAADNKIKDETITRQIKRK